MKRRLLSLRALLGRHLPGRFASSLARRLASGLVIGTLVATLVFFAAIVSGSVDQTDLALSEIGFDPDRAQLIAALLVGAVVAAASILAGNRIDWATLLGCLGSAALFGPTFVRETQSAAASTGAAGAFDLGGWLITLLALVVAGLISGWAGAALASVARPTLADTIPTVRSLMGRHRVEGRAARQLARVAVLGALLFVTVPVFGDIVNYTPDSHMLLGRPELIGLGGPDLTPLPTSATTPSPSPSGTPLTSPSATSSSAPSPSPSPTPVDPHPWLAWRPSGFGGTVTVTLPGPWKSFSETAYVTIYTPAGYSATGSRRYPVLYEAPYTFSHWNDAANIQGALDTLINRGLMPPVIVVAMSTEGGAFTDSECADSYDGREWFDTYVAQTVVPWVDSKYLTIAKPSARAVLGASQGGYCAAALAVHHPDVFGTSLPFSGYFHAGRTGPPSNLPFGNDPAFIDAASPDVVIFGMTMEERAKLYFVIVAQLSQSLYGPEATRFAGLLHAAGLPYKLIDSKIPHGWAQLRIEFGGAMDAWAAWMVSHEVF